MESVANARKAKLQELTRSALLDALDAAVQEGDERIFKEVYEACDDDDGQELGVVRAAIEHLAATILTKALFEKGP